MNNNNIQTVESMFNIFEIFIYNDVQLDIIKEYDAIWFRGREVATITGYKKPEHAVNRHVKDKYKTTLENICSTISGEHYHTNQKHTIYINEYGLYELVMKSKLSSVQYLQDWITEEVIPSIRRTGQFVNQELIERVKKLELENKTLTTDNHKLIIDIQETKTENKQVKSKLSMTVEDNVPLVKQKCKRERFVLIKLSSGHYYVIRGQADYTTRKLKAMKRKQDVILDLHCHPNSKSLYIRVRN